MSLQPDNDRTDVFAAEPSLVPVAVAADREMPRGGIFIWIALAVVVADQIAKHFVQVKLPLYDSVTIVPNLVDFIHVRNTGVAFGVLNDSILPFKTVVTLAMAAIPLTGVALYARHLKPEERGARLGLSLILGGAAGNLLDRLRLGYVVDFVDVYWRAWHFWAFNLADAAITIGAVFVFIDLLLVHKHASRSL